MSVASIKPVITLKTAELVAMGMRLNELYLTAFNVTSFVGWTYVQALCWQHMISMMTSNINTYSLYSKTIMPLVILQSTQWVELIHTLLKLTKSNLLVQICQIGGRFNALTLCLLYASLNKKNVISETEYNNKYLEWGYVSLLTVWSLAEVIRYPFYINKLLNMKSSFIEWLRYNAFIILYPIGFAAEMKCWYGLIHFLSLKGNSSDSGINYQYPMPNGVNFQLSLRSWAMFTYALTPCVGYYMYYGMLNARKKYIKQQSKKKQ